MRRLASIAVLLALAASPVLASNQWPQWRGPHGDGTAPLATLPLEWSETKNVHFKVPIPGLGLSTPVVWDDQIFLTSAVAAEGFQASGGDPVTYRFVVAAYSRRDGRQLWQHVAAELLPHEGHHTEGSFASASPITDGTRLFAFFGSRGIHAYTTAGKHLWSKDLGDMRTRNGFGEGASPALHADTLVVNWDHEGESFVVALDANTGAERWRQARPDEPTSWGTPVIVEHGGRHQVVIAATGASRGYDLETGAVLWQVSGMTTNVVPTPIHRDGVVYLTSGFRGNMMQAISLEKATKTNGGEGSILWSHDSHTPYVPSPVLYGDTIYFLRHFTNILTALDAKTGAVRYTEQRLEPLTSVYASLTAAADRIYVVGRDGKAVVFRHGPKLEVLARNELDDRFDASPVMVGSELILRGRKHLYSIVAADSSPPPAAAAGAR